MTITDMILRIESSYSRFIKYVGSSYGCCIRKRCLLLNYITSVNNLIENEIGDTQETLKWRSVVFSVW